MLKSSDTRARIEALRGAMQDAGLAGWAVPIADAHMSEYVGDDAQRLAWLTGFTGSAGSAVVLHDKAALFVDGRYTQQAVEQVPADLFEHLDTPRHSMTSYLAEHVCGGDVIGYDPWLHPRTWVRDTGKAIAQIGAQLQPLEQNLIDTLWVGRPARPQHPAVPYAPHYAGQSRADKLQTMAQSLRQSGADMAVIASLDGVAWSLNIRGRDIPNSPVSFGFLVLKADASATVFLGEDAVTAALKDDLGAEVALADYDDFAAALAAMIDKGRRVLLDPQTAVAAIFEIVAGAGGHILEGREPSTLPKACKNPVEQDGARAAHVRDGAAMCRFLSWFDGAAPAGELTELAVADQLARERMRLDLFQDLSFRTISAAAHHAALPHYSVTQDSNIAVPPNGLFLIDSGAQYLDGTTDITRTIQVGEISQEAKRRYTLVLKGHIAVATARFPAGTPGRAIDTLARMALWADGTDFDHGTGHGVGSYLHVHEGPQKIAKAASDEPLRPGMIVSNEPGYYKPGSFGIRIENLVIVQPMPHAGDEREMYGFETITFAPIDRRPIVNDLLTADEVAWLDQYHARVFEKLHTDLDEATLSWLKRNTRPLF
ncbi:MAG: aminopeptidase P family protein [Pseudomonadota bacterium]